MDEYYNAKMQHQAQTGAALMGQLGMAECRAVSLVDQQRSELVRAKANVARLEELLGLLDRNPDTARVLELLGTRF